MGSKFTAADNRAIRWFFENNPNLRAEMAPYPMIGYSEGETFTKVHISVIRGRYKKDGR